MASKTEEGGHSQGFGWPLEAGNGPQLTGSKKESQSYICKEINSANNLNEKGNESSPRDSRKACSPTNTLTLAC